MLPRDALLTAALVRVRLDRGSWSEAYAAWSTGLPLLVQSGYSVRPPQPPRTLESDAGRTAQRSWTVRPRAFEPPAGLRRIGEDELPSGWDSNLVAPIRECHRWSLHFHSLLVGLRAAKPHRCCSLSDRNTGITRGGIRRCDQDHVGENAADAPPRSNWPKADHWRVSERPPSAREAPFLVQSRGVRSCGCYDPQVRTAPFHAKQRFE